MRIPSTAINDARKRGQRQKQETKIGTKTGTGKCDQSEDDEMIKEENTAELRQILIASKQPMKIPPPTVSRHSYTLKRLATFDGR